MNKLHKLHKMQGALVGLAVGDAIGTTLEFKTRDSLPPVTDIVGGGVFQLEPGQWTDDTSMALALGYSLLEHGHDPYEQLRNYYEWYHNGKYSSNGTCFDVGISTSTAILEWRMNSTVVNNDEVYSSGNGSIMRLAPVVMYKNTKESFTPEFTEFLENIRVSSRTTHAYVTAVDACVGLGVILNRLFNFDKLQKALDFNLGNKPDMYGITDESIVNVLMGSYLYKTRDQIKSTGYCVDTLEAALWCVYNTGSFKDAVLLAANLGDDADSVAAVTGQIAGAYYGLGGIPMDWVCTITNSTEILKLAKDLHDE